MVQHSVLQLPIRNHNNADLQGTELRFSGKHYLLTDEMSILGQRTLAWVDKHLRQATGKLHEPLGGGGGDFSYNFWGFCSTATCWEKPIYATPSSSLLAQHGHSIYSLFQTIGMLTENIPQGGNNPQAEQKNFEQFCFTCVMYRPLKITGLNSVRGHHNTST